MNCKPGDLAIVLNANYMKRIIGRIVTCLEVAPVGLEFFNELDRVWTTASEPEVWIVDDGKHRWLHADCRLRPIRDSDGEDEILRIAGYPHKETA